METLADFLLVELSWVSLCSQGSMAFLTPPPPPPLPPWALGGQAPGGAPHTDNMFLSNMLRLWYMCGFHTATSHNP